MKRVLLWVALCCLAGLAGFSGAYSAPAFELISPDMPKDGTMPDPQVGSANGCTGENRSPSLSWSGAPEGTAYYALTVFDPDARQGAGVWHWLLVNIPAAITTLPTGAGNANGSLPEGALQLPNTSGNMGYMGACPPVGDPLHHYVFRVVALKDAVRIAPGTLTDSVITAIDAQKLGEAKLTVTYSRK